MQITAFSLAERYIGQVFERQGDKDHPLIQFWLSLCGLGLDEHDEVPWCSAFINGVCWTLRLPRSKSAAARSWLNAGRPIKLDEARAAYDVIVLSRGSNLNQGHVGFFAGLDRDSVYILSGNQSNAVSVQVFPIDRVIGLRRLYEEVS